MNLILWLGDLYKDYQLKKNGTVVYGKIFDFKITDGRQEGSDAIIEYHFNKTKYLQRVNHNSHSFRHNDSLKIICSKLDPELFTVVSRKSETDTSYSVVTN